MSERDVTPQGPNFTIRPRLVVIIIVVILAIVVVMSSFYVVDQTEQAVVLLFGKYNRTTGAGLHFKLPFGIEKNYNVPTQVIQNMQFGFRTEQSGVNTTYSSRDYPEESIMLTGDLNIVDAEWVVQYRINEPRNWLFNVEDQQKTIRDISQSVINLLVGDRTIFDVIGSERSNIELRGQERMNALFDYYGLGINVTTIKLRNVLPPAGPVQDAFEDVNKSIQDMNRFINEGKQAYNKEIPKARGQADQIVQQAEGYAAERVNEAEGDVARFTSVYNRYREAPDVTRTRLYYEMVEDVFAEEEGTDLIDRSLKNFIPFKPLNSGSSTIPGTTGTNQTGGGNQ
ncbi:MAG: FtsH protease activity modulator HflK [Spirochaetales bacterium]|nr:FtsH protease activity modulator HflK [Spirochaetales bacterium]MCF7937863.1 FtsH protease activity modulator HflK [Spirochaetales bacterium]